MTSLRINHNVPALNTHRNLVQNNIEVSRSLERLSSGLKINRAADGPASLMISEQLRAQVSNINQAAENSEVAASMVQTTEAALSELTSVLTTLNRLAIHAANEGANSPETLAADHLEFTRSLDAIDRISSFAQFGARKLLDGSNAANGIAIGEGVSFHGAAEETLTSSVEGYKVRVTQVGTQASATGTTALTSEIIDQGEKLTFSEGGRTLTYITEEGDNAAQVVNKLANVVESAGLRLRVELTENNTLRIINEDYGSDSILNYSSSTAGVLSSQSGLIEQNAGQDIKGSFDGEVALGQGRLLIGAEGTSAEGLQVHYSGDLSEELTDSEEGSTDTRFGFSSEGTLVGRVALFQNSLDFQVGPTVGQKETISLVNANTRSLGRNVTNASGYNHLRDIDVRTVQGAEDAQRLLGVALDDINRNRASLGAFQRNALEANLRQLRINAEELTSAESVIRDADIAKEITDFTRNNILVQSTTAMLAQANQAPQTVLSLLN